MVMFDDRELELIYEALHILLGDLQEDATFSEVREVEEVIEKFEAYLEGLDESEDYEW